MKRESERQQERELQKFEREAELVRQKEAIKAAKREPELELACFMAQSRNKEDQAKTSMPPSFLDNKDELDAYLQYFKRFNEC